MLAALLLGAVVLLPLGAQPPAPPPPAAYDVQIRYSIVAFRNERLVQYFEMMKYLKEAGFVRDPNEEVPDNEPEDSAATRLNGTIPADRARLLLGQRHVKTVRLSPKGAKFPADKDAPVRVHLELARPQGAEPGMWKLEFGLRSDYTATNWFWENMSFKGMPYGFTVKG